MKCIRCNIDMVLGQVIKPAEEDGCIYLLPVDPINARTLEIITCWKCPECGHSDYINSNVERRIKL
jgi:hypothetical protein